MSEKIKIGFIGLGQCGSNIAEIAELYSYRTAVCNTSPEDLEAIELIKNKVLLGSNGGAGKDRRLAKKDAKENYTKVVNLINEKFQGIEMVYFIFSAGGGTGSGMSPMMIDVVRRLIPKKKFGCITILPTKEESPVAQINALECLKEITRLEIPSFIVDNEKMLSSGKFTSRKDLFDKVNDYIINCFNLILNTNRIPSKYGNLDQQDIIKLLSTPGCSVIATADISEKERKANGFSFGKKVMASWDSSYFAPLEYDKNIVRTGYIYEIKDDTSNIVNYKEIEREAGKPIETFEGYYSSKDSDETVISIITGLSYPVKRINEIKKIIEGSKDGSGEERDYESVFDEIDTSWFAKAREKTQLKTLDDFETEEEEEVVEVDDQDPEKTVRKYTKKKKKEFDIEDIFANYE